MFQIFCAISISWLAFSTVGVDGVKTFLGDLKDLACSGADLDRALSDGATGLAELSAETKMFRLVENEAAVAVVAA